MSFIQNLIGKYDSNLVPKKVADIIPYDRNPKIHPDSQIEQLANSIREWGWTIPILIDEENMVIAGHGRLFAAQKLEMEDVPCLVVSGWSDEQKKAYVIADNKLAETSEWDSDFYFSELKAINEAGFNLDLIGVSGEDIQIFNFNASESDEEFGFDFNPDVDPTSLDEDSPRKKTDEGYVEFAVVMQEENKRRLVNRLNEIKSEHSVDGNEDALMILAR